MSEREQIRHARRQTLDAKLKTLQGREEIVALWKVAVPSAKRRGENPSFFQMVDEILDKEFPPV